MRRRFGRLGMVVTAGVLVASLSARGLVLRRQARLHEFYVGWYTKKADAHQASARECAEFGGDRMLAIAAEFQAAGAAERRLAAEHARLARAYRRSCRRPWVVPPDDPGPAPPP